MIIVLNGPSAGGKTTILDAFTGANPPLEGIEKLVTVTTRPPRPSEREGVDYIFFTPEQFEEEKARGNIVEETVYAGVKYGILGSEVERIRASGNDAMVVLDRHGIDEMKRFYGAENVVSIYVHRDLKDILAALTLRPISRDEVVRRFEQAKGEMKNIAFTDFAVYNIGEVSEVIEDVKQIILLERKKRAGGT